MHGADERRGGYHICSKNASILVGVGSGCLVGPAVGKLRICPRFRLEGSGPDGIRSGWVQQGAKREQGGGVQTLFAYVPGVQLGFFERSTSATSFRP